MTVELRQGDLVDVLAELDDASVDSVVADPPYGINFMGKAWDGAQIERDAREKERDVSHNVRLTGSPDSPNRKLIARTGSAFQNRSGDRQVGDPREVAGRGEVVDRGALDYGGSTGKAKNGLRSEWVETEPNTEAARRWQGWGTALKPAHEPIVVARKPLQGTVAGNVLEHGTGALNIDGCRVVSELDDDARRARKSTTALGLMNDDGWEPSATDTGGNEIGRWPANVVLDEEAAQLLDDQTGELAAGNHPAMRSARPAEKVYGTGWSSGTEGERRSTEAGGASRFFYVAKASRAERNAGLDGFEEREAHTLSGGESIAPGRTAVRGKAVAQNHHPTVKPIALMRWLVRLVTPPGGLILDPFLGSGTTGIAAALEGFRFLGIEREPDYLAVARARIDFWAEHGEDGLRIVADRDRAEAKRDAVAAAGQLDLLAGSA